MEHKSPPAVKVNLTEDEIKRIDKGPLKATSGRGRATWVRNLITKELDRYESIQSGNTQLDSKPFNQNKEMK
ncbi:glyoxalase/bleomycin resistance protein/dioxygenase [Sediminispirochaeta smaragdinae DSM 11293]|uniref:Glyoxalase/bleomycin resistance protein/dioxygenase n=2 Tax=Sediminispirochaeta TaxID=1911556 RepID=E1R6W0_SEDSS|nr:glyoxalase/bleomycin resistance protein/dioxygenase [Sediminispirochaeta smaragdinae DSM 11293]